MKEPPAPATMDPSEEISALVQNLDTTQRRLQELTVGQVDAVMHPGGHAYLLHKAQEKLQLSETVQRQLAETMSDILNALPAHIALLNKQGVIVSVNDIWQQFATANELQGPEFSVKQNYLEICERATGECSEEAHRAAAGIRAVLGGTIKQFSLEYPCHSPTEQRWFILLVTPVHKGLPAGAVVMHIDITERRRAEASLRHSEERLRLITNLVPHAIFAKDSAGRHIFANQSLAEMANLSVEEILGKDDFDLVSDRAEAEAFRADDLAVIQSGKKKVIKEEARTDLAGRTRFLHTIKIPFTVAETGEPAVLGVCIDITERKEAEAQLTSKTALLEAQVNSTLDGILVIDNDEQILLHNQRWVDLWSMPKEITTLADNRKRVEWISSQVTNPNQYCNKVAYLNAHPDESSRDEVELINGKYLERYSGPVRGTDGKHFGRIWSFHDITERKEAEVQLSSKTALLEAQLNSTLDGIIVVNGDGKLVLQNHKMIDLWNPPQEIFEETDHRKRLEWVALQVKNPQQFSERVASLYAHPDEIGRDELELLNGKYFERYTAPVVGRDGKHFGRIWAYHDVTERKQAAQELEELSIRTERRERLLSTALASMSDFAQIYDQDGRILFVNQPLLDLWALTLEQVVGKTFMDLGYPGELADKLHRQLQDVFKSGKEITDETSYTSPTGIEGYYEYIFSPAFSHDGAVDFVVGSTRDVTQRKQEEAEILLKERRYRTLVEATAAIVWDTPASGEFTVDQPGWTAFTGQTFDELRGWGWLNAIHPDDRAETARVWSAAVANRSPYNVEHRIQIPNKTYRNMLVRAVPIVGEDGTIQQWIGIHTDITERKQLENQFLRAQRMESIGTLAGGIAHDLNNSLAPIVMAIELLKMKFTDKGSQELLATLGSSAQRSAEMVRQVLSFARGVEGRKMEVQVKHVLKDIEKIATDTFPKNIQVRSIIPNELWTITGDPTQLHQVLLNFCVNARDAMPAGGILTIAAENVHLDEHYAGLNPDAHPGSYVFLQITDTGSGMPPEVIEKIFDPFFTTKEIGKGTGLGLSTSLAIVKSHGGFIRVYSETAKGTTFKAYFPAQTEPSTQSAEQIAAELPRGNGELILVVDDEASVRQITRQTLEAFGYSVILASDGAEAVAIVARQDKEIAVVLTDMMMPVMDGPATIQVLLRLNPKLPIIAASGISADGRATQAASLGVKHFLAKPYAADALLQVLRQVLSVN